MLYDSYHKKISKVLNVLRKIFKHIVLISVVTVLVIASIITILATKGIVLDDNSVADNFEMIYGDSLPLDSNALFSKVIYEYSTDGVEWTTDFPYSIGKHMVRATAKTAFGKQKYGKIYNFSLMPKEINVSVVDDSMIYGDVPKITSDLVLNDTIVCDKFDFGDRLATDTTIAPNLDGIKISNVKGEDVTSLYKINPEITDITVLPRAITVTVSDREMIYNDTKLAYDGYELSVGSLAEGDILQAVFNKYLIDVGEVQNIPELKIVTSDGLDISIHYTIFTEIGKLKVDYRPLIIKTGSSEKTYDDKELSNTNYDIVGEYDIVEGHVVECVSNASIIDVDTVDNVLALQIKNAEGEDKTSNYSLFYERGTLSISPRPVNISTESGTWVYDGKVHSADILMEGFCEGHNVKASWPDIIDVGVIDNSVEIQTITDKNGREVSHNYDVIHKKIGVLTVTKCPITISHETHENNTSNIFYDGTEQSFENYTITSGSLAANDTLEITYPTFFQAGIYTDENKIITANVVSQRLGEKVNFEASENYEITEVFGTIVINKRPIKLEAIGNVIKTYDGAPYIPNSYRILSGSMLPNHILNVAYLPSGVDVGKYNAEIDLSNTNVMYMGSDVTSNFDITVSARSVITINPREITLQPESLKKTYDGKANNEMDYTIIFGELVSGHEISNIEFTLVPYSGILDENLVGKYISHIEQDSVVIIDDNNVDVTKNYAISYQHGMLEILKRKLSITTNSETKIYDRKPLEGKTIIIDDISETNDGLLEGHEILDTYSFPNSIINVGTVNNQIVNVDIVDENNQSVKDYYIISVNEGILEILPIELTITTYSKEKVYDGTPLTYPEFTFYSEQKLLENDTLSINVVGTITNAGTVDNSVVYSIYYNGIDMTDDEYYKINYKINLNYGELKVTPRPIKITPLPTRTEKLYDGTPLECFDYVDSSDYSNPSKKEGLLEGHQISEVHFNSLADAGEININVDTTKPMLILCGNENVTNNYTFVVEGNLTFKVIKRNIIIFSDSAKKEFDGKPLEAPDCFWSSQSEHTLLDGHNIDLKASGSQTIEGQSPNIITSNAKILDANGNDYAKNYNIAYSHGTLEVYKTVVAKVYSTKSGYLYLKAKSYGDYDGQFFGPAPIASRSFTYNNVSSCSYSLWTSAMLNANNRNVNSISISQSIKYLLPYYMYISRYNAAMPQYNSEDYTALSNVSNYTVDYFDYSFETEGTSEFRAYVPNNYLTYTRWVQNNYLTIDESTKLALLDLVKGNGFESLDPETRIKAIAAYVRTSANYNSDYPVGLDFESDVAVAFLKNYREGSAKHYAVAATMLYRSLDIPARCVEGYIVNTVEHEETDVKDAHYWVEVFLERFGWMQIEVTTGFGGMEDHKIDITVKPKDKTQIYNGEALEATEAELFEPSNDILALFEANGYKIVADFQGSQINIGSSRSTIVENSVRILDANDDDITYKFNIENAQGELKVTPIPIDVYLYSNYKIYDGKPLSYTDPNFYYVCDEDFIKTGYKLELEVTFNNPDVHILTAKELTDCSSLYVKFKVKDGITDLTSYYCLNFVFYSPDENAEEIAPEDYIVAKIEPKHIEITSATKVADYVEGVKLVDHTIIITKGGPLPEGHTLNATTSGELDAPGVVENTIIPNVEKGIITDDKDNDVTKNYVITMVHGTLIYVERE